MIVVSVFLCFLLAHFSSRSTLAQQSLPYGVRYNEPPLPGYVACYWAPYSDFTTRSSITSCCSGSAFLLVAGFYGSSSSTFVLGAYDTPAQICTDTTINSPHYSNGIYWYLTSGSSFGFSSSSTISQSSADTAAGADRLSWHLDQSSGGYRVGDTVGLNSDTTYYKAIFAYTGPPKPSAVPTRTPTQFPTKEPTYIPTVVPTTATPTYYPTSPTSQPSSQPSHQPSSQPSSLPSLSPSSQPSTKPSNKPTGQPSSQPTHKPSSIPTKQPSRQPSVSPSGQPSATPTLQPFIQPSSRPSQKPSGQPSNCPSAQPSRHPSTQPTTQPTTQPSVLPTHQPSREPSSQPSNKPSGYPSAQPSVQPSTQPSVQPSSQPSVQPTDEPSNQPTSKPSSQPSMQPSVEPSGVPTGQPTVQPTIQPSKQPSNQPSSQPSTQPSSCPSSQPSIQPSTEPTMQPSAQPSTQPSIQPSTCPSCQPSCQPSSTPTIQPTVQPSARPSGQPSSLPSRLPTSQPTQSPTILYRAPEVLNVQMNISSSSVTLMWELDKNSKFAGTMYVAIFSSSSAVNVTKVSEIKTAASADVQYVSSQSVVTTSHTGLVPMTTYTIYAYIETLAGYVNPLSAVSSSKRSFTTTCCKSIGFETSPVFLYADASRYTSSGQNSPYMYKFFLSSLPTKSVEVRPQVYFSNGTAIPSWLVTTLPTSITITSSQSIKSSFILLVRSLTFSDTVVLSLAVSGVSSNEYGTSSTSVKTAVVGNGGIPPSPTLSNIIFGDSGKTFYVLFDSSTDLGGKGFRASWVCSEMLSFAGSNVTSCTWLNLTAIIGVFPTSTSTDLVSINGNVTLLPEKVRAYCEYDSGCAGYNASPTAQTLLIRSPTNAVSPSVIVLVPARIGSCDNVTVSAMTSSGHGGRKWQTVTWSLYALDGDDAVDATEVIRLLNLYGSNLGRVIQLPRSLFKSGKVILSLTLSNFFGKSSTGSASFTVLNDPMIPSVYLAGSSMVYMRAYSSYSAYSSVSYSSCSKSYSNSVIAQYDWKVYEEDTGEVVSVSSTSRTKTQFALAAFSLTAGVVYKVALNVTLIDSAGNYLSYGTASQGVTISRGNIFAYISGGNTRNFPTNKNYTLSAASSFDEDSRSTKLTYFWTCLITSLSSFGTNCTYILNDNHNSSSPKVSVMGRMLNASLSYEVTVTVWSSDGRSNDWSITIQATQASSMGESGGGTNVTQVQLVTEIATEKMLFNYNSNFSVISLIQSSMDTSTRWEVYIDGRNQSVDTNSALSRYLGAEFTSSTMPLALIMQAYSFVPGSVVYFRIFAQTASVTDTVGSNESSTVSRRRLQSTASSSISSFSEISISINGPPTDGIVTCSPTSGAALSTVFAISTSDWEDTNPADYPLRYIFQYSLAVSVLPSLTIQGISTLSSVSSQLPAGLQSYDYSITLLVTAYDVNDAPSIAATTSITVTLDSSVNFTSYLTDNLAASLAAGDTSAVFQTLSNVASMVNVVNCSSVSATYCASLNRAPCVSTPQVCGSCLSGYTGIVGNANSRCFNQSSQSGKTGSACTVNDDCLYGQCSSDLFVCVEPLQSCATSVTEAVCSGHGSCSYQDNSGREMDSAVCTITNINCKTVCKCLDGYGGQDCSLSAEQLLERSSLRGSLCSGITSVQDSTDESSSILESLSSAILSSYSPYEIVSDGDYSLCASALSGVSSLASKGYLQDAPISVVENLVGSVSSFVDSSLNATTETASMIEEALDNVLTGVADSLTAGHYPLEIISSNIRLAVHRDFVSDLYNVTLSPPQSDEEVAYSKLSSNMQFDGNADLNACSDGTGYVKLSLAGYGRVPFPNSTRVESPMLRLSSETASQSRRRTLLQSQSMASLLSDDQSPAYYFTVQFMTEQDFTYNLTAREIAAGGNNLTFPECRVYDSASGSYKACFGCVPSTYTNFNVTFVCTDIGAICGGSSSGVNRRQLLSPHLHSERKLQGMDDDGASSGGFSIQQYGAIVEAAAEAFVSVLSRNPFAIDIRQATAILSLVGTLIIVFVSVGLYLYRMDEIEAKESIIQKRWPPQVNHSVVVIDLISWICGCIPGLVPWFETSIFVEDASQTSSYKEFSNGRRISSKNILELQHNQDIDNIEASRLIVDSIIPDEYRQLGWWSLMETVVRNHTYLLVFTRVAYSSPRFIRWVSFIKSILLALFIDTLFFQVFYGNDGTCELYTSKVTCLTQQNAATGGSQCMWETTVGSSTEGSCSLRPPPEDFTFQIMLALLTMLIAIPIDIGLGMVVDMYCNHKPDWSKWNNDDFEELNRHQREAAEAKVERRKMYAGALNVILQKEAQTQQQQFIGVASVTEELELLKSQLVTHFEQSLMLYPSMTKAEKDAWLEIKQARAEAISHWFGIAEDGKVIPLPWYSRWMGKSWQGNLMERIETTLGEQEELLKTLDKLNASTSGYLGDLILLHTFVLEQMSTFQKWVLVSKLGCFDDYTTQMVHPYKWIGAWLLIISVCLFFVYWIFAWGVQDGDAMLNAWGTNYAIGFIQDFFFVSVVKTLLFYFIGRQVILPQLHCIHDQIMKLMMDHVQHQPCLRKKLPQSLFKVVGFVSPAVRVSTLMEQRLEKDKVEFAELESDKDVKHLQNPSMKEHVQRVTVEPSLIRHVLSTLDDCDVLHCKVRSSKNYGWAGWLIVFVPVLLAIGGEQMADVSLDMVMPSFSSAFLLANYVLQQLGWAILMIPYLVLVALVCWQQGVFRWIEVRLLQLEERTMIQQLPACRNNMYLPPSIIYHHSISGAVLNDAMVYSRWKYVLWRIVLWIEPRWLYRAIFVLYLPLTRLRREREQRKANSRWLLANVPYDCRPVILPDDKAISSSFLDKSLGGSKTSVLVDVSEYESSQVKDKKRDRIVEFAIAPEITALLVSSAWTNKLNLQAIAPTPVESTRDPKASRLETRLLKVRKEVSLRQWVLEYENQCLQQQGSQVSKRNLMSSNRTVAYKKKYGVVTNVKRALVCILEDYLLHIQFADERRPQLNYHQVAKKMILKSHETPIKLTVAWLLPVLRRRLGYFSQERVSSSFVGVFHPGGHGLSADQVDQVIENFLQWVNTNASNPRESDSIETSIQVIDWEHFVPWVVSIWCQIAAEGSTVGPLTNARPSMSQGVNPSSVHLFLPLILQEKKGKHDLS